MRAVLLRNKILLLGLLICCSVTRGTAQAALSPIQFLPGDNVVGPAAGDQGSPFISRGATNYLVVWVDKRTNLVSPLLDAQSSSDIYAARITEEGTVIDSIPFIVSQKEGKQTLPRAAWNGHNWLVAWISQEATPSYFSNKIVGVRVSSEGTILDSDPVTISTSESENPFDFALASGGADWLAVWSGNAAGSTDIKGARIDSDGVVLDPGGIVLQAGTYYVYSGLDVAFTQGSYLIVWEDLSDCRGRLFDSDLRPLSADALILSSTETMTPRVAASPTDFLVTFGQYVSTTYFEGIFSRTVSPSGQLGTVKQLFGAYIGTQSLNLNVVWDGTHWIVNWNQPGDNPLRLARVSAAGAVLDAGGVQILSGESEHIAPGPNGGVAAVFSGTSSGSLMPYDVFFSKISSDFSLGSKVCVSLGAPSQIKSHLAGGAGHWMITYLSLTSSHSNVMVLPLDAQGATLAPQPMLVAAGERLSDPSIAWDGSRFLVTWHGDTDSIYARRFGTDGTALDALPIKVMPGYVSDVAAVDGLFLVVSTWKIFGNPQYVFPTAVRVRGQDGAVLDATPVVIGSSFAIHPRVETAGGRWLAVFERHPSHDAPDNEIIGSFVDTAGHTSGPFTINGDLYSNRFKYAPDLASTGSTSLVVWQDPRVSNADWNIQAARVQQDQTVLDYPGFSVSAASGDQSNAAIAFDGSQYVVAYEDQRANTLFFDGRTDLYLARVSTDGTVPDAADVEFSSGPQPDIMPAVVSWGGSSLIAGSVFRDEAPFAAYRLALRSWSAEILVRGDANQDGNVTSADVVYLVGYVFKGGAEPLPCASVGDVNCSAKVSSADIIYLLNHVFKAGPAPCQAVCP